MLTGDSGEKCPVRPIRNVLKNSFIFQSEWDRFQKIFGIIGNWIIFYVWDNGQDFSNFKEASCQDMLFDAKTWTCYWKGVFVPML